MDEITSRISDVLSQSDTSNPEPTTQDVNTEEVVQDANTKDVEDVEDVENDGEDVGDVEGDEDDDGDDGDEDVEEVEDSDDGGDAEEGVAESPEIIKMRRELFREKQQLTKQKDDFRKQQGEFFDFWTQSRTTFQHQAAINAQVLNAQIQSIQHEAQQIEHLRVSDPDQHRQLSANLQHQYNTLQQQMHMSGQQYAAQEQAFRDEARKFCNQEIKRSIPNFSQRDNEMMGSTLSEFGFTAEQMKMMLDPRILKMAHGYAQMKIDLENIRDDMDGLRKTETRTNAKNKTITKTPKKARASKSTTRPNSAKQKALDALQNRFKKEKNVSSAAPLIENLLFNN